MTPADSGESSASRVQSSEARTAPPDAASSAYRPEVDGLRALAVIAVIINHCSAKVLPGGHLGVDIFFVISGFVITSSLSRRPEAAFVNLVAAFYARRVKRLIPALVAATLVGAVAISLFNPKPGVFLKTGLMSLFGASNLYLYRGTTDYFGPSAQLNMFTHTWSLGVEEQYYVLFPLVVWATGLGRRRSGPKLFALIVGLISLASLALSIYLSRRAPSAAFFLMPARLWELGIGSMIAVLPERGRATRLIRRTRPLVWLVSIVLVLFLPAHFSSWTTAAIVLATALLITSDRPGTPAFRVLSHPAVVYVGQISYSLYLWHWMVIVLGRWTIGTHWWSVPVLLAVMFFLADRSYRLIEKPLRGAQWAPSRLRTIAYGFGASGIAAGVLLVLLVPLNGRLYAGTHVRMLAKGTETLSDRYVIPGSTFEWRGAECVLANNSEVGKTIRYEECTLGDPSRAKRRVLVVGNSFSASFVAAFDDLVRSDGYAVTIASSYQASPAPDMENDGALSKANAYYWAKVVPELALNLGAGDWMFAISDLAGFSPASSSATADRKLTSLADALRSLSARVATRGVRLAVLHANSFARESQCDPDMAAPQWFAPFGPPCVFLSRAATLSRRAPLDAMLASLQRQGVITIVDLLDVFCPGEVCTYNADGRFLYRDVWSHPSIEAARLSASVIRSVLMQ